MGGRRVLIRRAVLSQAIDGNREQICEAAVSSFNYYTGTIHILAREREEMKRLSYRLENYFFIKPLQDQIWMEGEASGWK